jgi:hypothetical protein
LHAQRGSVLEDMPLVDFVRQCEAYFANEGCIVDEPFQARKALIPPPPEGSDSPAAQPGPRIMHPASASEFEELGIKMESEWTPQMMHLLGIDAGSLPIIWDFLYGPRDASGQDTYVLCEINVSSVFPFPEQATSEIARLAMARLQSKRGRTTITGLFTKLCCRWRICHSQNHPTAIGLSANRNALTSAGRFYSQD